MTNTLQEIELELMAAWKELQREDKEKSKRTVQRRREHEYRQDLRRCRALVE